MKRVFFLGFMLLLCATLPVARSGPARIYVVAVRDSGLFTLCPSPELIKKWRYPNRTQSLEIIQNPEGPRLAVPQHMIQLDRPVLDRSRSDWWTLIGTQPGFCPSGKLDLELKRGIEKQLSESGEYLVADSAQKADLVFVAEGLYGDRNAGFLGAQIGRYGSSRLPILGCIMATVVPAQAYMRSPGDSDLLLGAGIWSGSVAWKSDPPDIDRQTASEPASIPELVARFLKHENGAIELPPLCSARTLVPAVDGTGAPRAKAAEKRASAEADVSAPAVGVIKVDVSMVTIPTMVSDAAGKHLADLAGGDFHVFENGVEQKIDRVIPEVTPFNVVLMLDTSGSTVFRHEEIQRAALAFIDALRPEDRVMVVSFDSYIYLDAAFTNDRAALRRAVLRTDTGAGTRLYDAMDLVLTECLSRVAGRKAIVLFTDGMDSQSWLAAFGNYQEKVEESDAVVYAVQYDANGTSRASQYLNGLAQNSGGRLFLASTISNLSEAFAGIADELQHQYTICFYPSNQNRDSALRLLRVTVDTPGTKIRNRTGYRIIRNPAP